MSSLPDPSRIPACKYLWRDAATDPRLVAVGAAARGLYFTVLAACDAEGVLRHEGTVRAEQILAHYCGESLDDVKSWIARLVREGLLREELFGLAIPADTFFRRQPQLRPCPDTDAPAIPLFAAFPPAWPDARPSPAARHGAPRSAQVWIAGIEGEQLRAPRAGVRRVRTAGGAAKSSTERSDRRRYAAGTGRFRSRPAGMPFEAWLVSTVEGRSLLAMRREVHPHYARGCTPAAVATGTTATTATQPATRQVPLQPVAPPLPPQTPRLSEEIEEVEGTPTHPCNDHDALQSAPATEPPRCTSEELLELQRSSRTLAARTVRAFLDAVNGSETLDGTTRSREVVVESGRYTKHEHLLTLGAALLDAGATPGSSLLGSLVRVLRDREAFRRVYARRRCAALGKITASELVHNDAFALQQALEEARRANGERVPPTAVPSWAAQSVPRDPLWTGTGPDRSTRIDVAKMMAERSAAKVASSAPQSS